MFIENVPPSVILPLPQIGLIFIGILVERHYVSRVTCFANSLVLLSHVGTISNPDFLLGTYAEIGLVLGIVGIIAYLREISLPDGYYLITLLLYSGLPVGLVIVFQNQWLIVLLVGSISSLATAYFLPTDYRLVHTDSLPGSVYNYAKNRIIEHTDYEIGYRAEINLLEALQNK